MLFIVKFKSLLELVRSFQRQYGDLDIESQFTETAPVCCRPRIPSGQLPCQLSQPLLAQWSIHCKDIRAGFHRNSMQILFYLRLKRYNKPTLLPGKASKHMLMFVGFAWPKYVKL